MITLYGKIPETFEIFVFSYTFWFMFIPKPSPIESTLLTKLPMYLLYYTIMPLFALLLDKSSTFTHYMRYSLTSCTKHPTKGQLARFVNISLDIVSSYRLFLGTTYHRLHTSFQIIFTHLSPCLFLSLSSISLANCPCILFSLHSCFFILL